MFIFRAESPLKLVVYIFTKQSYQKSKDLNYNM